MKKYSYHLLLLILVVPTVFFLFKPNLYFNMHDDMQMIRQLEMEKCLRDGQIPCRWVPDLGYEYGYPLFNFYPPLPYIVGQIIRFFGTPFYFTVKLVAALCLILSAFFMYLLAIDLFKSKLTALVTAVFYAYTPYRALNIYIRGAMNEAWASVFFPLIFLAIKKVIDNKTAKPSLLLAVSISFLMLSHNPMLLIFAPFCLFWIVYLLITNYHKQKFVGIIKPVKSLVLSALWALGLSAFFTIPMLFETKLVQISSMFSGYYEYIVHFANIRQLFISNFWGDGASVWGDEDQMSFMVGYLHWIIPLIVLSYVTIKLIRSKKFDIHSKKFLLFFGFGLFSVFMTHSRSTFIWKLFPPFQKIQFPWRFLNVTAFFTSIASGFLIYFLVQKSKKLSSYIITTLVLIGLIFLNLRYFWPLHYGPITDTQKFDGLAWTNQITSGIYDYLPVQARIAAQKPSTYPVDDIQEGVLISNSKKGTNWGIFDLNNQNQEVSVILSILYFPKLEIYDNFKKIDFTIESELGRPVITLSKGQHQIYYKYKDTPIRILSNLISVFSFILLTINILLPKLWKKIRKKSN